MSQAWWRFHVTYLTDPTVQQLPPDLFKIWVNINSILALLGAPATGRLPQIDIVAYHLRMSIPDTIKALDNLVEKQLITSRRVTLPTQNCNENETEPCKNSTQKALAIFHEEKDYFLKAWSEKQYKSDLSTDRVKRFRERSRNAHETPPDQIRSDTDQIPLTPKGGGRSVDRVSGKKKPAKAPEVSQHRYDVIATLTEDQFQQLRDEHPGMDIQALSEPYNAFVRSGQWPIPKLPFMAIQAFLRPKNRGQSDD